MGAVIVNAVRLIFRFFGLDKLAGWLLAFFSSGGIFANFFLWIGKKISIKALVLPIQFAVMGALFLAKISFLITAVSLVAWLYNRVHDLRDLINSVGSLDNALGVAWQVLQSIGFADAFFNTLSSMSFIWFSVLVLIVSKFVLHSLKMASDEMFKIGLLLGQ